MEQEVLAVMLQVPGAWQAGQIIQVAEHMFGTPAYVVIAQAAAQSVDALHTPDWFNQIGSKTPEVLHTLVRQLGSKELPVSSSEQLHEYATSVISSAQKKLHCHY